MGIIKLQNYWNAKKARLYTRFLRKDTGGIGRNSTVFPPFYSNCVSNLFIGNNINIRSGGWIETVTSYGNQKFTPELIIGDGTYIGHRCHIIACCKMIIGKDVTIADNVYITDNMHGFSDLSCGVMPQALTLPGSVTIEDEAWIGEKVCIMPNVTIGKHSVIGANSVVTKNIPPYSIAVGSPAKVIKKYCTETGNWESVKENTRS